MFTILYKGYPIHGYCETDTVHIQLPIGYFYRKGLSAGKRLVNQYLKGNLK